MDTTIDPEPQDSAADTNELPVSLDTLAIDGTRPKVGDRVDVKVNGPILKIVNDMAIVKPETANDQPIPQQPPVDDMDQLAQAAEGQSLPLSGSGY
jgi:hypothetical protein